MASEPLPGSTQEEKEADRLLLVLGCNDASDGSGERYRFRLETVAACTTGAAVFVCRRTSASLFEAAAALAPVAIAA